MIAADSRDVVIASIGAAALVVTTIVPIALLNRRSLKRTAHTLDTHNDKTLGETVHDIAKDQEFVVGQLHVISTKADYGIEVAERVDAKFDEHIALVGDVQAETAWVRKQMAADQ
jgi:hypothetical protein